MARLDSTKRQDQRERELKHDEFYESMAAPARAYYEQGTVRDYSTAEQVISIIAAILNLLLALRFVLALFTSNTTNGFVALMFGATDWLVTPFQSLFNSPPPGGGSGYFDLPALAAIVFVWVLAWVINMIARGSNSDPTT